MAIDLQCILTGSRKEGKYECQKQVNLGGGFWEDGYFARTVGDNVTAEVIRKYIQYHCDQEKTPKQLELF